MTDVEKKELKAEILTEILQVIYPINAQMTSEMIPHLLDIHMFGREHIEVDLTSVDFLMKAVDAKKANPNMSILDILEATKEKTEQKDEVKSDEG